jgi:hypothetical protein
MLRTCLKIESITAMLQPQNDNKKTESLWTWKSVRYRYPSDAVHLKMAQHFENRKYCIPAMLHKQRWHKESLRCPYNSPPYSSPPYNSSPYSSPPYSSPPLHLATLQLATITSRHRYISPPLHLATITFRHHYISPVLYRYSVKKQTVKKCYEIKRYFIFYLFLNQTTALAPTRIFFI